MSKRNPAQRASELISADSETGSEVEEEDVSECGDKTNSDENSTSEEELDSERAPEGIAQPAAQGAPQPTVGRDLHHNITHTHTYIYMCSQEGIKD